MKVGIGGKKDQGAGIRAKHYEENDGEGSWQQQRGLKALKSLPRTDSRSPEAVYVFGVG